MLKVQEINANLSTGTRKDDDVIRHSGNDHRRIVVAFDSAAGQRTGGCHLESRPVSTYSGHVTYQSTYMLSCDQLCETSSSVLHE